MPGFRVAGKTGTAQRFDPESNQYSNERPVVSFVGIVPADRPEMVIAVVLNEPEGKASGGMTAAPLFREIASSGLHYRRVSGQMPSIAETNYPFQYCSAESLDERRNVGMPGVARIGPQGTWTMPDLRSLPFRTAFRALEGLPVNIEVEGSGRILRQDPGPGASICAGHTLRLAGLTDHLKRSAGEASGQK